MTLPAHEPIDLLHQGMPSNVGCYLVETDDGPALFDCGPATCVPALKAGLAERGLELGDIRHLLLSHIHLDHAGAAGTLVREHPALQVHVSAVGAPHLSDPSRLEASARRLYGDSFDPLWGELAPVPAENIRIVGDDVLGLECFPSPGHASHHVSMLHEDGTLYAGDSAGVRIAPASVRAAADAATRHRSRGVGADDRRNRAPSAGPARADPFRRLRGRSPSTSRGSARRCTAGASGSPTAWTGRRSSRPPAADCLASDPDEVEAYDHSAPFDQCFLGLERYWRKRGESAA